MAKSKGIYHCPELCARDILNYIKENPKVYLKDVKKIFANKFQRTDRTIANYLKLINPELKKLREERMKLREQRMKQLYEKFSIRRRMTLPTL